MASSVRRQGATINIDSINVDYGSMRRHNDSVSTYVRTAEAAEMLGVSKATLYSYVSRGRLVRTTAPDGRTSLFARDHVEQLATKSRRATPGPRPSIDVQIDSTVTALGEGELRFRGHDVVDLVASHSFEDIAELLWSEDTGPQEIATDTTWAPAERSDLDACGQFDASQLPAISRMAMASYVLDSLHPDENPAAAARRTLSVVPALLGSSRKTGSFALRLAGAWRRRPEPQFVAAIDTALGLLADHGLATSTIAVRIAASVRTTPYVAFAAGFAAIQGALHGSASAEAHEFLAACANRSPTIVIREHRAARRHIPGFGHKIYRGTDPRFHPMLDMVEPLDSSGDRMEVVYETLAEVGRTMPHPPNVDLALGALSWIADLDPHVPLFAIARTAGWAAHFSEEMEEAPVRFRGISRTPAPSRNL